VFPAFVDVWATSSVFTNIRIRDADVNTSAEIPISVGVPVLKEAGIGQESSILPATAELVPHWQ
jgi:hypothetical protein